MTQFNLVIANLSCPNVRDKMSRSTQYSNTMYKIESLTLERQSVCDRRPDQNSRDEDLLPSFNPHYPSHSQHQPSKKFRGLFNRRGITGDSMVSPDQTPGDERQGEETERDRAE